MQRAINCKVSCLQHCVRYVISIENFSVKLAYTKTYLICWTSETIPLQWLCAGNWCISYIHNFARSAYIHSHPLRYDADADDDDDDNEQIWLLKSDSQYFSLSLTHTFFAVCVCVFILFLGFRCQSVLLQLVFCLCLLNLFFCLFVLIYHTLRLPSVQCFSIWFFDRSIVRSFHFFLLLLSDYDSFGSFSSSISHLRLTMLVMRCPDWSEKQEFLTYRLFPSWIFRPQKKMHFKYF